jgi:integrase/recombinase XerD
MSPAKNPSAAGLIEAFLEMMSAERGAGANTLMAYRRDLADFAVTRKRHGRASREEIKAYLARLSSGGIAASSQARKLSALRQFYGFLFAEEMRPDNPTEAVDSPRSVRPLPKILSASDMEAMIAAANVEAEKSAEGKRLLAIVEMLYAGGLRVSELAGMPLASVMTKETFVLVRGKGNKERLAPLNPSARMAIKNYLEVRGGFLPKHLSRAQRFFSVHEARKAFSPGSACISCSKGWRSKQGLIPRKSRRMCCAMLSPHIWWKAARICAVCRVCLAMPTSPPPRFTPMSPRPLRKVVRRRIRLRNSAKLEAAPRTARPVDAGLTIGLHCGAARKHFPSQSPCGTFRPVRRSFESLMHYLEFERPIAELEGKIVELRKLAEEDPNLDINGEVAGLKPVPARWCATPMRTCLPGRRCRWRAIRPGRTFLDYAKVIFEEFMPLAGDR